MLRRDPQTQRLYLHDAITEKELDIRGTEHLKTHRGSDTTNSELYTADILRNALNVKSEQHSAGRSIDEMAGEDLSNVGHMKEEAFPKLTALPETPALCGGMLLRTVYPPPAEMSTPIICRPARRRSWPPSREATRLTPSWALIRGSGARRTSSPYREAIDSFGGVDDETPACPTHIKRACGIASQTLLLYMCDAILRRRLTSRRRCRSDRPCCRCSGPDSRRWYSAPPPWARPRPRSRSGASPWCHRRT